MKRQAIGEYIEAIRERYKRAGRRERSPILDEAVQVKAKAAELASNPRAPHPLASPASPCTQERF